MQMRWIFHTNSLIYKKFSDLVPKAGLEPARISTVDFESALKGMRKRCGLYLSRAALQATTRETRAKCPKNQRPSSLQLRHRQPNHPRRLLLRQRQHLRPHVLHHVAGELLLAHRLLRHLQQLDVLAVLIG